MTDLERLHLIHETLAAGFKPPRRAGYTFYACHCLCGNLLVTEHETIPVYVLNAQRIDHFTRTLLPILKEYDIELGWVDRAFRRIYFQNNTNTVKFITRDYLMNPNNNYSWEYPDIDRHGFGIDDLD